MRILEPASKSASGLSTLFCFQRSEYSQPPSGGKPRIYTRPKHSQAKFAGYAQFFCASMVLTGPQPERWPHRVRSAARYGAFSPLPLPSMDQAGWSKASITDMTATCSRRFCQALRNAFSLHTVAGRRAIILGTAKAGI